MPRFDDRKGQSWDIDLTVGTVSRVRKEAPQFNLYDPSYEAEGRKVLDRVCDLEEFWELLWYLVEPQANARDINAEQFGELMAADCLVNAQQAFFQEWHDFFLRLQRPDQALALEKMKAYRTQMVNLIQAKVAKISTSNLDQRMSETMEKLANEAFGNLQESLDSTLGPSRSDNSTG